MPGLTGGSWKRGGLCKTLKKHDQEATFPQVGDLLAGLVTEFCISLGAQPSPRQLPTLLTECARSLRPYLQIGLVGRSAKMDIIISLDSKRDS
jgi:hypothetical protein